MKRARVRRIERIERYLVRIIQQPGADQGQPRSVRLLLAFLTGLSKIFGAVVALRLFLYRLGLLHRFPLGCQVISIGNITAGGTGKTPVTEIFARELQKSGRKVAILSRGYRKKESTVAQRMMDGKLVVPPRVVSDGKRILLDSEMGGDEPYMLASNLPGVVVVVDKDRVKAGRYAIKHFGCDTLILDDGFQHLRLQHHHEVTLVDKQNPFGNRHMLPRGILREPIKNIKRADFIFITKSDGKSEELRAELSELNPHAEIIECCHEPRLLKNVYSGETLPLEWLKDRNVATLSGIAVPQSFENSLRRMGAHVIRCDRYADHHRYAASEIIDCLNRTADIGAEALITTEKDAVRFPRLETTPVPVYYLRIDIKIIKGAENFQEAVARICSATRRGASGRHR